MQLPDPAISGQTLESNCELGLPGGTFTATGRFTWAAGERPRIDAAIPSSWSHPHPGLRIARTEAYRGNTPSVLLDGFISSWELATSIDTSFARPEPTTALIGAKDVGYPPAITGAAFIPSNADLLSAAVRSISRQRGTDEVRVDWSSPQGWEIACGAWRVSHQFSLRGPLLQHYRVGDLRARELSEFTLTSDAPLQMDHVWETVRSVADLLSLCCGERSDIGSLDVKANGAWARCADPRVTGLNPPREHLRIGREASLTGFWPDFPQLLASWLRTQPEARAARQLFFSLSARPDMYVEQRLLTLTQAAEVFHRDVFDGVYVDAAEYEQRIRTALNAAILKATPDARLRSRLKSAVQYGNELALRPRLRALVTEHSGKVPEEFSPDPNAFVERVVSAPNALTHSGTRLFQHRSAGRDLFSLGERLRALLACCFLKHLDVDDDHVHSAVIRSEAYFL